jgi:protein O-GlcNAc transferase
VGRFLLPLLKHHDRAQVEVYAYSLSPMKDSLTDRLKSHADVWRQVESFSDQAAAEAIRRDKIDILVDLAMHTGGNGLRIMAMKPAPVQFSYLAYCSSTGIDGIDYRFSDPHLDPPDGDDSVYSERTIRLPKTWWCYEASETAGKIAPRQREQANEVVFGCLNSFSKASRPALQAWARILRDVPGSRLILHAAEGSHRLRCAEFFEREGVSSRIGFAGYLPMEKYLELYNQIDIALDPFPYCGGTTTCDALWMGVPVVTLAGATAVGRVGKSILSNVGLPEFVAGSVDEYVKIAEDLAENFALRQELGCSLRQRMENSPLMDGPGLTREIEAAYRQAWKQWTSGAA